MGCACDCHVVCVQVTSKGAGLNPNAKVWQEMPAVPSEAPVDATEASPWSQSNITEGNGLIRNAVNIIVKNDLCYALG